MIETHQAILNCQFFPALHSAESTKDVQIGTTNEVWRQPLSEIIVAMKTDEQGTPKSLFLYQNYPNPFKPTTVISFDVPIQEYLSLTAYHELGRRVKTLIDVEKHSGSYKLDIDESKLASGVYLYRVGGVHKYAKGIASEVNYLGIVH